MHLAIRLLLIFPALFMASVRAEVVELETAPNITSSAEFLKGDPEKPLLLFIHGFLQTRTFSTVERLYTNLNESGYPILAPTLSLGASDRTKAVACEAIHLHSLDTDSSDMDRWVRWAVGKGYNKIVLIGHSAGSVNITAYLDRYRNEAVKKSILVSLTHFGPGRPAAYETEAHAVKARRMVSEGDGSLAEFSLAYCTRYVTTPERFLSYYDWSADDVIRVIDREAPRCYVVMGANDQRIGSAWLQRLRESSAETIILDGASHFFDQTHEFDLLQTVEGILEE